MVELPSNDEWPAGWRYKQKRGDYFVLTYDLHEHHVISGSGDGWVVEYKYNGKPNGRMSAETTPETGFERLKRDLYNNFLAADDKPHGIEDVYNQTLPTYAAVPVECVPDADLRPVTGDRRVSNYQGLPAHEFIVREYGDGWARLDVRTVDSVEELEERVKEMDLPNDGPISEVNTRAPMELDHFAPEEADDKPTRE
jgi:hypothetical protein